MKPKLALHAISMLVVAMLLGPTGRASAQATALQLYPGGDDPDGLQPNQVTNSVFFDRTFSFEYSGGPICMSSQSGVCTAPAIDDAVRIFVDGTQVLYQESNTHDFGPVDFSGILHAGATNQVRVQLIDLMGPSQGGSALWLVPTHSKVSAPKPASLNAVWNLHWTPSFVMEYDTNRWSVQPFDVSTNLVSTDGAACRISQIGPTDTYDVFKTEVMGQTKFAVFDSLSTDNYIVYISLGPSDEQTQTLPAFEVDVPPSVAVPCLSEAKTVLSTLRLASGVSRPGQNQPQPALPPQQPAQAQPAQPPFQGALPGDGHDPSRSWVDRLFVPRVQAADDCQSQFQEYTAAGNQNCTWYVAGKRPDACIWLDPNGGNDAYKWAALARGADPSLQMTVSNTPHAGDIAVWNKHCAEADTSYGHVGYVTSASIDRTTFRVDDRGFSRLVQDIPVQSCMSFISKPLTPDFAQSKQPPPSGILGGALNWLKNLFGGK